jgi:hypothetical protein
LQDLRYAKDLSYVSFGRSLLDKQGIEKAMSRKAKGKRPAYFRDAENDKLLAIVMALAGELSVLHERLDTVERIVEAKGLLSLDEIERYRPDDRVLAEREKWRTEYLERILRIIRQELESAQAGETAESYEKVLKLVSAK